MVRAGLAANTSVTIDDDGKIHVASVKAIEEPPSLIDLRKRVEAMMPRVDISEAVVEVLGWCPKFMEAFTSIAGTGPHLDNLDISVAACLTAQAPALERHTRDLFTRPENTVSSIARLSGVSHSTLYRYLPKLSTGGPAGEPSTERAKLESGQLIPQPRAYLAAGAMLVNSTQARDHDGDAAGSQLPSARSLTASSSRS